MKRMIYKMPFSFNPYERNAYRNGKRPGSQAKVG